VQHELSVKTRRNIMKNVTITMEDSAADWARMEAARRNTSVSRLVGELVAEKMLGTDTYSGAMHRALEFRSIAFEGPFMAREEIYAERLSRFR
jgi:hypothetical protein